VVRKKEVLEYIIGEKDAIGPSEKENTVKTRTFQKSRNGEKNVVAKDYRKGKRIR